MFNNSSFRTNVTTKVIYTQGPNQTQSGVCVCVCVCVCEEEVLRNAGNVYCSVWEGVMGGRLLCFMVLGTADLSAAPASRDQLCKNLNNGMVCMCVSVCVCVCVSAHFAHQSACGKIPNNPAQRCPKRASVQRVKLG